MLNRLPLHVALISMALAWVVPSLGLLVNSVRTPLALNRSGWWEALAPPFQFTLDNYARVLDDSNLKLGQALLNGLVIAIPGTVLPIALAAFAAHALAWMNFRGRTTVYVVLVGLLVVPLQLTMIPILRLFVATGLVGTFASVWLAHTAYGLPLTIYLLHNFFRELPPDLFESAEIDGASPLTVFFRIVLPLSMPALAAVAIFQFLFVWNDLLVALVFLGASPEVAPITVVLAGVVSATGLGWEKLAPAAFLSIVMPLIVFFSLQRYFVRGLLAGSVKG